MSLELLLKEAITNPEKRSVFLQTLIRSDVYVICVDPAEDTKDGLRLRLKTIVNPENKVFIPFFTSYNELLRFTQRYVEHYKINCLRLFDLIQSQNAVLNPNYYSKEFSAHEIEAILTVARTLNIPQITMKTPENILFSRPTEYFIELKKFACKFFGKHDNVNEAYILMMQRENSIRPQILIVVSMIGNSGKLFREMAKSLLPHLKEHESLSFITTENQRIQKVINAEIPFYIRKRKKYESEVI